MGKGILSRQCFVLDGEWIVGVPPTKRKRKPRITGKCKKAGGS